MSEANDFPSIPAVRRADLASLARGSVSTGQARLSRLMRHGVEAAFDGDAFLELQFVPDAAPQWIDSIVLAGPFGEIECEDGPRLLRALTGIEPAAAGSDAHAAWLNGAIVGRLGATPFNRTDRLLRKSLAPAADTAVVRLVLRSTQHAITTHARATPAAWLAFLQDTAWTPRRTEQTLFADVPFSASVHIARHTLPADAMRGLAAGDIIVPDSPAFACNGMGKVRLGGISARVRYQAPASLYIISTEVNLDNYEHDDEHDDFDGESDYMDEDDALDEEHGESDEDAYDSEHDETDEEENNEGDEEENNEGDEGDEPHAAAETDPAQAMQQLDRVPVTLDFTLGKVRMSLGELRALAAGSVVEIEGGSPSLIAIHAGGRKLGQGEIVDVDGRLGIRLTDWRA
jgi:type III secretion protein Q